jgi:hypothetical protein
MGNDKYWNKVKGQILVEVLVEKEKARGKMGKGAKGMPGENHPITTSHDYSPTFKLHVSPLTL